LHAPRIDERAGGVEDAPRRLLVPPAEDQEVSVIEPEAQERLLDGKPHGRADARVALQRDDDVLAAPARAVADGGAEAGPRHRAPGEPVPAAPEGALDVRGRDAEARAEAERGHAPPAPPERPLVPGRGHGRNSTKDRALPPPSTS